MWAQLARVALVIGVERRILTIVASYAMAIGLFSLVVPLTVQELINTFAFAIQPIMIVTLALIMLVGLLFIGFFRVLQTSAMEVLFQRLYARIAIAMTEHLPRIREEVFAPSYANYFGEAELLPRAIMVMLVDLVNVAISGTTGMLFLIMYHPYFLLYDAVLLGGFVLVLIGAGQGGVRATQVVSQSHYDLVAWMQDLAHNRLHFKATDSAALLLRKTDRHLDAYLAGRRARSAILTWRQYVCTVAWEAVCHSGMIGVGGWLLSIGQITLGQFVAAEVIVSTLLLNLDTVTRRMYAVTYILTSLDELTHVLALPKDDAHRKVSTTRLPDPAVCGLRLTAKEIAFAYPGAAPLFSRLSLDIGPGEKVACLTDTSSGKTTLALVLAGIHAPTAGVLRYNDVDVRDLNMDALSRCRGVVLDSHVSLFDGTVEENISLGRPTVRYEDIQWALRFAELDEEVEALPLGLHTPVQAGGKTFTASQILRILVARAIVTRPQLLIFDGTLHNMAPRVRQILLRRLCSKDESWAVMFVSNDPAIGDFVERRIVLS